MSGKANFLFFIAIIVVLGIIVLFFGNGGKYSSGVNYFLSLVNNNQGGKATEYVLYKFTEKDWESMIKLVDNESEKIPPIYIMLVSDYVYTKDKDKAIVYYYTGRLRAKEDVYMCKDKSAAQQIYMYPKAAPETLAYAEERIFAQNDKQYLADVLQQALDWDMAHPKRYDPTWACYHGISNFYKKGKPELVSKQEQEEIIRQERENVEKTIEQLKSGEFDLKI